MPQPFNVQSQTAGTDLGSWDGAGNLIVPGYIELADQSTTPASPASGKCRIFSKAGQLTIADNDGLVQLTAGAVSTTAAGTIAPTTSAGGSPTVTITDCTDQRGNFLLNAITGGGAQAAGKVAVVKFARPYTTAPGAVVVSMANETDSTAAIVVAVLAIATTGFDLYVGTALTTAKAYRVSYVVYP